MAEQVDIHSDSDSDKNELQREVVDQSADERDPADDSGEADDPNAMVEAYPQVFDDRIAEAERAIDHHRIQDAGTADR